MPSAYVQWGLALLTDKIYVLYFPGKTDKLQKNELSTIFP